MLSRLSCEPLPKLRTADLDGSSSVVEETCPIHPSPDPQKLQESRFTDLLAELGAPAAFQATYLAHGTPYTMLADERSIEDVPLQDHEASKCRFGTRLVHAAAFFGRADPCSLIPIMTAELATSGDLGHVEQASMSPRHHEQVSR